MSVTSILIVGVGGQGIVLAGDVIGRAAQLAGMDVKANEVHGMSQRGGSVQSEVRFGEKVYSPLIPPPGAQFVLGFELLEGLRALAQMAPDGIAIVNRQRIVPSSVTYATAVYPEDIEETIAKACPEVLFVDALGEATKLGNTRTVNTILMGVLAARCSIPVESWEEAIRQTVKPRFVALNLAAFAVGRELGNDRKEE